MGKRGNDNAQLSKEEYDALEAGVGGGDGGPKTNEPFAKASPDVLGKRRIFKSARKWKSKTAETSSSSGPSSTNLFANLSGFGGTPAAAPTAAPSFSFASSAPAPAASGKPTFAMPTLPPTATVTATNLSASSSDNHEDKENSPSKQLIDNWKAYVPTLDVRTNWEIPSMRFVTCFLSQQQMNRSASNSNSNTTASTTNATTSKPLFPPVNNNDNVPAAFSFGGGSSPVTTAPASSGFSFAPKAATAPAAASTSGFSFAPATQASPKPPAFSFPIPTPATTAAVAPTGAGGGGDQEEADEEPPTASKLESADGDWNQCLEVKVKAYHHRNGTITKFATADIKLQEHKTSNTKRMVMRNAAGKVLLNVGITNTMKFDKTVDPPKSAGKAPVCRVAFYGLRDQDYGPELFTLICKHEKIEEFHAKLVEMSS